MNSIFAHITDELFAIYRVQLEFRDRVVGGTPSNPKLIEAWLRSKMHITREEELKQLTLQTLRELGLDPELFAGEDGEVPEGLTFETLAEVAEKIAKKSNTSMFKRDEHGLYVEQRALKACLKENAAIVYPGSVMAGSRATRWPPTGKSPRSALAEWVFIEPDHISLGVQEPTGVDLSIGHITGPQGPRSTLDYYEYVERATIEAEIMVLQDRVPADAWPYIWREAEENGLGAKRSQGFGRFWVKAWDPVNELARNRQALHAKVARKRVEEALDAADEADARGGPADPGRDDRRAPRSGVGGRAPAAAAGRGYRRELDPDPDRRAAHHRRRGGVRR